MTYTAEQLRDMASLIEEQEVPADGQQIKMLRAHADALEENARLTRECEFHAKQCARVDELRHRAEAELAKLRQHAEAMAGWVRAFANNVDTRKLLAEYDAYRADFPEEK